MGQLKRGWKFRVGLGAMLLLALAAQAEDGVTARQVLIGQTLTLQGGANDYGVAVSEGVTAALDQANRAGGVLGRQIALTVLDDDNKAALAETNARQLVTKDKVFLLFGPIEGGPSTAVMKRPVRLACLIASSAPIPVGSLMANTPSIFG